MVKKFQIQKTDFTGAMLITPFVAEDERGSFIKDFSSEVFAQYHISHNLKEVFYTESRKGVIRAIHFQRVKEQAKLVRCQLIPLNHIHTVRPPFSFLNSIYIWIRYPPPMPKSAPHILHFQMNLFFQIHFHFYIY